jgi:hypothetical protein
MAVDVSPSNAGPSPVADAVLALLRDHVTAGLVIDVDGRAASIEDALVASGLEYAACTLADLDRVAGDRAVVAVVTLGGPEHCDRVDETLSGLRSWIEGRSAMLVLSASNVANVDVASKLLAGRWDMGERGDHRATAERRHHFTDATLRAATGRAALVELAVADVIAADDDRPWPRGHPTRSPTTLTGRFVRWLRQAADPYAEVTDFVRIYRADTTAPVADHAGAPDGSARPGGESPFLTVITRTMGRRASLVDTLTCLAAQTDDDFEVRLMLNTPDPADRQRVIEMVEAFHPSFRSRVHLHTSGNAHRVSPLNDGLEQARGRYVTVLDDDDLVVADWVARFHAAVDEHDGAVVRCRAVDQRADALGTDVVATATSGFLLPYRETFDLASHLAGGQTPQGSVCFPMQAVAALDIRFDCDMEVCEDLDFLLRVATVCGVVDTGTIGMIYRRWNEDQSSMHSVAPEIWEEALRGIVERLDEQPLLMPPGTAQRLYQAAVQERQLHELGHGEESLLRRMEVAERNWSTLAHQYAELEHRYIELVGDRDAWKERAERIDADGSSAVAHRFARLIRRTGERPGEAVDRPPDR